MNIKLVKKVVKDVKVVSKKTGEVESKNYTNYYLILPNGQYVAIKPAFNNDYKVLYVLADLVD